MSIYLDNGATSFPKAPGVGEAMLDYVNNVGANVNRSTYETASTAAMILLDTREQLCRLFNFEDPTHVIFTPGMTAGLNMLLKGFLKSGDHVIVSSMEHNAMMRPLVQLEAEGVEFSRIPADSDGITRAEDVLPLIRPNTKLVAVMHASNVCGSLLPIKEIGAICRKMNLPLILDAAQTAGHYPIDFNELSLSALCAPAHKGLLGPQGLGVMLIEKEFAKSVQPLIAGGTGSASDSEELPPYMPDRFESGTMNIPGIYGLNAALNYILETGVDSLRLHEERLTRRFLDGLKGIPVRIAGTDDISKRVGVVAVDFLFHDNAEAAFKLEQAGILTRCGLHCAPSAHKTLGTFPQGVVRFSLGYASTETDVDGAIAAIRSIARQD